MRPSLDLIADAQVDVIVVGGGINGTSSSRYLARAGYRVLLTEKDDFGSGASGRSSRLIHNGIWYLATDDRFWRTLAHPRALAHRLGAARGYLSSQTEARRSHGDVLHDYTLLLSVGSDEERRYRAWQMRVGFLALNLTALGRGSVCSWKVRDPDRYLLHRYHRAGRESGEVVAVDDVLADSPERICIDLALEAEEHGATVANHAEVMRARHGSDGWRVTLGDLLHGGEIEVRARFVVNTAGAWAGDVDRLVSHNPRKRVDQVKGAHLVVDLPEFQPGVALLTSATASKEPFFAMPFRGMYLMGNTHSVYRGDLEHVSVTDAEVEYLLAQADAAFPGAGITARNVVYTYAGVRPMSAAQDNWALDPRIHDVESEEGTPNLITVVGAPIGTFHAVGRQVSGMVARRLGPPSMREFERSRLAPDSANAFSSVMAVETSPLCDHGAGSMRDAARGLLLEHGATLGDILCRRTLHVWNRCMGLHIARHVADRLALLAGWSPARTTREVEDYIRMVESTFRPELIASGPSTEEAGDVWTPR